MRPGRETDGDRLNEERILSLGSPLARAAEFYEEIPSTQSRAMELARAGARNAVVVSRVQRGGRGRVGRVWGSPEGGLWMSVVVAPELPPEKAARITQSASVAVAKALREFGVEARIKWPNDLLVSGRKVSGVLAQSSLSWDPDGQTSRLEFAVLGIGINANLDAPDLGFPDAEGVATTIRRELGHDVSLLALLASVLERLDLELDRIDDFRETLEDLRALSCTLGRHVRARRLGEVVEGLATDITSEGALILSTGTRRRQLFEGEIEHLRATDP